VKEEGSAKGAAWERRPVEASNGQYWRAISGQYSDKYLLCNYKLYYKSRGFDTALLRLA
jgi:hypothetical protein